MQIINKKCTQYHVVTDTKIANNFFFRPDIESHPSFPFSVKNDAQNKMESGKGWKSTMYWLGLKIKLRL